MSSQQEKDIRRCLCDMYRAICITWDTKTALCKMLCSSLQKNITQGRPSALILITKMHLAYDMQVMHVLCGMNKIYDTGWPHQPGEVMNESLDKRGARD